MTPENKNYLLGFMQGLAIGISICALLIAISL